MDMNKTSNKFLLGIIKKACLDNRLDCDDLISIGLELRNIKIKDQRKKINEILDHIKKS